MSGTAGVSGISIPQPSFIVVPALCAVIFDPAIPILGTSAILSFIILAINDLWQRMALVGLVCTSALLAQQYLHIDSIPIIFTGIACLAYPFIVSRSNPVILYFLSLVWYAVWTWRGEVAQALGLPPNSPVITVSAFLVPSFPLLLIKPKKKPEEHKQTNIPFNKIEHIWLENKSNPTQNTSQPSQAENSLPNFSPTGPFATVLKKTWDQVIVPYGHLFTKTKLDQAIYVAFSKLDEEGHVPSVVDITENKNDPDKNLGNQYDSLREVPLAIHTANTIQIASEKILKEYSSLVTKYPTIIMAAVVHDFGKMPSIRPENYKTSQHPLNSASWINGLLEGHPLLEQIKKLILEHHMRSLVQLKTDKAKNLDLIILISADQEAREKELQEVLSQTEEPGQVQPQTETQTIQETKTTQETSPKDKNLKPVVIQRTFFPNETRPEMFDDDFVRRVLYILKEQINQIIKCVRGHAWSVLSSPDGNVYVHVDHIHRIIGQVAVEERKNEDAFYTSMEKEVKWLCLRSFYSKLVENEWHVPEVVNVKRGFFAAWFTIYNPIKRQSVNAWLMPIKPEAFDTTIEFLEEIRLQNSVLKQVKIQYGKNQSA